MEMIIFIVCAWSFLYVEAKSDQQNKGICEGYWHHFEGLCYNWLPRENLSFSGAREKCKEINSTLAKIENSVTYQFLKKTVVTNETNPFWSGLDKCDDANFYWTDGSLLAVNVKNWASGEPNNFNHRENCVEIYSDTTWNDISCEGLHRVICQNMTCYKSKKRDLKDCFYNLNETLSWWDAKERCEANGDILPMLDNDKMGNPFKHLLKESEESWIGLQRGYLCWSNKEKVELKKGKTTCKATSKLNRCNCVTLSDSTSWREISCTEKLPFVCEKGADLCKDPKNDCHKEATCISSYGSYHCECNKGYTGNGKSCEDIDECKHPNNDCPDVNPNAVCVNTIGSYKCQCKKGYIGNGVGCEDMDECKHPNNCFENAVCINTVGSYKCQCRKGYIGNGRSCKEPQNFDPQSVNPADTNEVKSVIKTCSSILQSGNQPETLIMVIEDIAVSVGEQLNDNKTEFVMDEENIMLGVFRVKKEQFPGLTYPDNVQNSKPSENKITFPSSIFSVGTNDQTLDPAVVVGMIYDTPKEMNMSADKDWFVNSETVSGIINPAPGNVLKDPVKIQFKMIKHTENAKIQCSFLKFDHGGKGVWSSDGCKLVKWNTTHATCECNHLTNFAILMKVDSDEIPDEHKKALSIITYIGLSTSILGCLLTLIIHLCFKKLRMGRGFIHINLVIALALADVVFMVAILADHDDDSCLASAVMVFYFFLALFFWMLVEGLHIYLMVSKVFDVMGKISKLSYCLIGWGLSALIVALTYGILRSEFLSEKYCWLSTESGAIWAFVGPITFIILVNVLIMILVLKLTMAMVPDERNNTRTKSAFRVFVMLTPILGVTWIFGILTITKSSNVFQYVFAILNSFQGFLIFILYCIVNKEARREMQRKYRIYRLSRGLSVSERKLSSSEKARVQMSRTPSKTSLGVSSKRMSDFPSTHGRYTPWPELAYRAADPYSNTEYKNINQLSPPSTSGLPKGLKPIEYPLRHKVDATGQLFAQPDAKGTTNLGSIDDKQTPEPDIYPLEKSKI